MALGETTPVLGNGSTLEVGTADESDPITPGSQARAAWVAQVSTPSGKHLLDPFPGNDTLPGDITPVDEPILDDDGTPTKGRGARLKLVKVHPTQHNEATELSDQTTELQLLDTHVGAGHALKRSSSQVTFSDNVESRAPPSAWASNSYRARNKYAVAGDDRKAVTSTAPEGCGSPRRRVAPPVVKDPRAPRLLTGSTLGALPGGYDDVDEHSACCVIS